MTDAVVHQLETTIREATATRHDVDKPDREMHAWLMSQLNRVRHSIQRQEVLRLEVLIERRTGVNNAAR